jgi:hypothetical protein
MTLRRYIKKHTQVVEAMPLAIDGATLKYEKWGGQQQAQEGDWLVNNSGEFYTVEKNSFANTYQKIFGNRYRKVAPVWAEVADKDGEIVTKEGLTHYQSGDVIVCNNENKVDCYAIAKDVFVQTYQPDNKENKPMLSQDYIEQRVDDQITWYEKKSCVNQKRFKSYQLASIVLAAAIPLLTVISLEKVEMMGNILPFTIAVIGTLIAIFNAVLGLYKFQENWVQYRSTAESLIREKYLFLTQASPYTDDETSNFKAIVERCEGIMSSENSVWIKATTAKQEENKKEGN